jgi:transposase
MVIIITIKKGSGMAYSVHQINKKTGITYVYEAVSCWDKEKKQARNKQVCVGKLDSTTGKFIPSKRLAPEQAAVRDPIVTASAEVVGASIILDTITDMLGLKSLLKSIFPSEYRQILTMAYYLVSQGGPLSHCGTWCKNHAHPFGTPLTSQCITETLRTISIDKKQTFFTKWMDKVLEDDYLCYDITSISSYSELNEYIKYGHNRDLDKLPQLNLAILFGQKSRLPVYFERTPGNITDVTTLHNLIKTFKAMETKTHHYVLDKGFYSKKNVDELLASRDKFMLSVPLNNKWVQHAIDDIYEVIHGPEGYQKLEDEILYVHSRLYPWGKDNRRCYLHLYYNAHARANAVDKFSEELVEYKKELESDKPIKAHQEAYDTFFVVKTTPKRGIQVSYNTQAVNQYINRYAGFQALLTNSIKSPTESLQIYRDKDIVEKCFDDLKNQLDMKRLRMHSSATVDGRLFVQFIALIYVSALRREMRKSTLIERYTVRELLQEMDTLTKVKYSGKYGHILTEMTKPQREILEGLNITLPGKT